MQQQKCITRTAILAIGIFSVLVGGLAGCHEDRNEKISTIYELKSEPTDENKEEIRGMLDHPDRDVRATALHAMVSLNVTDARQLAQQGLSDEDGFVRATAAKLLADLDYAGDANLLAARLAGDSDPVVRRRAAEALSRMGGAEAVAGLAVGLRDPMEDVRLAATRGLRELDPSFARADLARLLLEDPAYEVRIQAARALGDTGDAEMLLVLESALEDPNEFVRAATANALRAHKAARESAEPDDGAQGPGESR